MRINDDDIEYDDADRPTYEGKLFTGTIVENYASGIVATEIDFKDGQRHGKCRFYFPDGKLEEEREYSHGAQDGLSRSWYKSGVQESEAVYGDKPRPGSLLLLRTWDETGKETTV